MHIHGIMIQFGLRVNWHMQNEYAFIFSDLIKINLFKLLCIPIKNKKTQLYAIEWPEEV